MPIHHNIPIQISIGARPCKRIAQIEVVRQSRRRLGDASGSGKRSGVIAQFPLRIPLSVDSGALQHPIIIIEHALAFGIRRRALLLFLFFQQHLLPDIRVSAVGQRSAPSDSSGRKVSIHSLHVKNK